MTPTIKHYRSLTRKHSQKHGKINSAAWKPLIIDLNDEKTEVSKDLALADGDLARGEGWIVTEPPN